MALKQIVKATAAMSAVGFIALVGMYPGPTKVYASQQEETKASPAKASGSQQDSDYNLSAIGLLIAPDFINTQGKDPTLVGLGSFIVNAQADCNGCHGSDPANEFLPTNNPYWLPKGAKLKFNQATYLIGGQNFGTVGPGIVKNPQSPLYPGAPGLGPNIITRNLTPDYTGNPAGGITLKDFTTIIRTGHDFDTLHLNCGGTVTDNCYLPPVNGAVLQVMPWVKLTNMTDYQIKAIWTYLSTVPCFSHTDGKGNSDPLGTMYPWLTQKCF